MASRLLATLATLVKTMSLCLTRHIFYCLFYVKLEISKCLHTVDLIDAFSIALAAMAMLSGVLPKF